MTKGYRLQELKIDGNRKGSLMYLYCSSNGAPPELTDLIHEFADIGGETLAISGCKPLVYKNLSLIPNVYFTLEILGTAMTFLNSTEQPC